MSAHSHSGILCHAPQALVDSALFPLDTPCMARPDAVRRVKSYSAASGFVYQYYFFEVLPARRTGREGREYTYMVSADRRSVFPLKIFVEKDALAASTRRTGRGLTGTEEYAVAKLRLFQAFDELNAPLDAGGAASIDLRVDQANLDGFLQQLDL